MEKITNTCEMLTLKKTARFLKKHNNYIILTHASPDGDTLGSAYALYFGLKKLGKKVEVICPDLIPSKFGYFAKDTDHVSREGAKIIAVDVADKRLLGSLQEQFGDSVDLNIDHHISNVRFARALYLDADASATCEIIFELLLNLKVEIDDITAKALYTGIATDTGCFKYSNVTSKTHLIASMLYDNDIKADVINKLMFDTKSKQLLQLERMVLDTAEYHFDDKCFLLSVTAEIQETTGCCGSDLEGISVISRSVEGVLAGVTIKQIDTDTFKVSVRTYKPLDASVICKALGGGGHKGAAGATLKGTLSEVKAKTLEAVKAHMEEKDAWSAAR